MFEEAMENVTEAVTENVTPVVETVADTAVEVMKNAEWKLDSKSFGEGFVAGAAALGIIIAVPKLISLARDLFSKSENEGGNDDESDDGDSNESEGDNGATEE